MSRARRARATLIVVVSCAQFIAACGAASPIPNQYPDCTIEPGVAAQAARTLDQHLSVDATASIRAMPDYLTDGFGGALASPSPMDAATRSRWIAAIESHPPPDREWSCHAHYCFAPLPDCAILREIMAPIEPSRQAAAATLVFELDEDSVFAIHLIWSAEPIGDIARPLDPSVPAGTTEMLSMIVCPSAELFIDDRFVGLAPLAIPVSVGVHRIGVRYHTHSEGWWLMEWSRAVIAGRPDGFTRFLSDSVSPGEP